MYLPIGDAAGEGDQVDVRVGEQLVGDLARVAGHDREHLAAAAPLRRACRRAASADSGVFSVGFSTIRLLVAIAGATLCATWFSGWLNGVIAEITPSSGSRSV